MSQCSADRRSLDSLWSCICSSIPVASADCTPVETDKQNKLGQSQTRCLPHAAGCRHNNPLQPLQPSRAVTLTSQCHVCRCLYKAYISLDDPPQEQQQRVDALQEERAALAARLGGAVTRVSPQQAGSAYAARASQGSRTAADGRDTAVIPRAAAQQGAELVLSSAMVLSRR